MEKPESDPRNRVTKDSSKSCAIFSLPGVQMYIVCSHPMPRRDGRYLRDA